jgi:uncharacterized RDD family membrane protein YckC
VNTLNPAPLLQRIFAFLWDYLPILAWLLLVMVFGIALGVMAPDLASSLFGNPWTGQLSGFVLVTLPVTLYFALAESSPKRATWGKRRRGLVVQTVAGDQLSLGRALGRTLLKFVPWELSHTFIIHASMSKGDAPEWATMLLLLAWALIIGNVVSIFVGSRRQTLYDRLSGTVVVQR